MKILKYVASLIITGFLPVLLCGIIRTVALDGSQQYTSIQGAITASASSDTVLVYPGRYYENITISYRDITLASLELITNDQSYIATTIIDGCLSNSVVSVMYGVSNVTIRGFVITNGIGTFIGGGLGRGGGGIIVYGMINAKILNVVNCHIYGNNTDVGGGIAVFECNLSLQGTSIRNNYARLWGGGIDFHDMTGTQIVNQVIFDPINRCNVYSNYAGQGNDIFTFWERYIHVVVDTFTVEHPTNFYLTMRPRDGSEHNTVFDYDILHHVHQEINSDFYVSPEGDDNNSGLSPTQPLRTIAKAVYLAASDSLNPKTVYLSAGVYSTTLNGQRLPVSVKDYLRITGESPQTTIIEGRHLDEMMQSIPFNNYVEIANMTLRGGRTGVFATNTCVLNIRDVIIEDITNPMQAGFYMYKNNYIYISNCIVRNCYSSLANGRWTGINIMYNYNYLLMQNTTISDMINMDGIPALSVSAIGHVDIHGLIIKNITDQDDGGNSLFQISAENDENWVYYPMSLSMSNCLFYNITQTNNSQMGIIITKDGNSVISNCTFAGNGGGSHTIDIASNNMIVVNNVFWNPAVNYELFLPYFNQGGLGPSNIIFNNNCIRNGMTGVVNGSTLNQFVWEDNNISANPQFVGTGLNPYYLSANSPLIDAGTPDTTGLYLPLFDVAGNERLWDGNGDGIARIDIGAYEYQPMFTPLDLQATVGLNTVHLNWAMPNGQGDRSLCGYRVYRDSVAIADISNPEILNYIDHITETDTLTYWVVALYGEIETSPSNAVTVYVEYVPTADETAPALTSFRVYPNPFRDKLTVRYRLSKTSQVRMNIYNVKGQLIRTINLEKQGLGEQIKYWDGRDLNGESCSNGVYLLSVDVQGRRYLCTKVIHLR